MLPSLPDFWALATTELSRANVDRRHPFRNVVLATCADNLPSQRTVVMRHFDPADGILIYTDRRSQKFKDLQMHSANGASLHFWHPKKKLQICMAGQVKLTIGDDTTMEHWKKVPPVSKRSYTTAHPPGTIIEFPTSVEYNPQLEDGKCFALLQFQPRSVQLLQLNRDLHLRAGFSLENGEWTGHWLVP